jgi:HlyD family secretion protein
MLRKISKYLTYLAIVGALAVVLVLVFRPQPQPVDLAEITLGSMSVSIDEEGRTQVKDLYRVLSPVNGSMGRIKVQVGDEVRAYDTLIASIRETVSTPLDQRSLRAAEADLKAARAALALTKAQIIKADAELVFARAELKRSERLRLKGNISGRSLDLAKLEVEKAEAAMGIVQATQRMRKFELERAEAALMTPAERELGEEAFCCLNVSSPVNGRILRLLRESAGVVQAGTPLVEIGDPLKLEIVVDLLSNDAVKVAPGMKVAIENWGGLGVLNGKVKRVEPYGFTKLSAIGVEEQRVNVIIDLIDPVETWRSLGHGFRVEVKIEIWTGDGILLLPLNALFRHRDSWAVFRAIDGRAILTDVRIGQRNQYTAEVLDGLSAGDLLILFPSDKIEDGGLITPRDTE